MDTLTLLDPILSHPTPLISDRLIENDNYENNNIIETAFNLSNQRNIRLIAFSSRISYLFSNEKFTGGWF